MLLEQSTGSMSAFCVQKIQAQCFLIIKKYFSVVLQGVVDANYKFTSIDVGEYGKQSDEKGKKKLKIPEPSFLPQTNVKAPYVLLSDEAYPLLNFALKPYGERNSDIEKECFNNRLSKARKTVECAFRILCAKWRILPKPIETAVDTADNIVKYICDLHNTILSFEGFERHLTEVEISSTIYNLWQNKPVGRPTTLATNTE